MIPHYETQHNGYTISTNKNALNIPLIHQFLSEDSYWAQQIPLPTVITSINNSLCFGMYFEEQQVGFARLITDAATFAYLADVFIVPAHRGKGLSKWMLATIHAHPHLQGLRRWLLGTKDAHSLYEQFGWKRFGDEQTQRFMQLHNPNVYSQQSER
jgi:GNAT superfamily N-acetyltransferase